MTAIQKGIVQADVIAIRRVREAWGWLGNMSPHAIAYAGESWPTAEALFQAMRFDVEPLRQRIRAESNPMKAKMLAKSYREIMTVTPQGATDVANMRTVLRRKVDQHPWMAAELASTGDRLIVEDCTYRQRGSGLFWGAALVDGAWKGENVLGRLWMELRAERTAQRRPSCTGGAVQSNP